MSRNWKKLQSIAQNEVETTLASLPAPIRKQASPLPVSYEARPLKQDDEEDYDPDLLGLFVGASLPFPDESPLPPQIILYLENLWEFAERHEDIFCDEVRTTYLHELGHYLGLDEIDLEARGLE